MRGGHGVRGGQGVLGATSPAFCCKPPDLGGRPPDFGGRPPDFGGSGVERLLPRGGEINKEKSNGKRAVGKRSKLFAASLYESTTSAGKNARASGEYWKAVDSARWASRERGSFSVAAGACIVERVKAILGKIVVAAAPFNGCCTGAAAAPSAPPLEAEAFATTKRRIS